MPLRRKLSVFFFFSFPCLGHYLESWLPTSVHNRNKSREAWLNTCQTPRAIHDEFSSLPSTCINVPLPIRGNEKKKPLRSSSSTASITCPSFLPGGLGEGQQLRCLSLSLSPKSLLLRHPAGGTMVQRGGCTKTTLSRVQNQRKVHGVECRWIKKRANAASTDCRGADPPRADAFTASCKCVEFLSTLLPKSAVQTLSSWLYNTNLP